MFGRWKRRPASGSAPESKSDELNVIQKILRNEAEAERMRAAARDAVRPFVRLVPKVPLTFSEQDSWFGGNPRLPEAVAWPERDGVQFRFVCQINLSNLPRGLWSGVGPRNGWLAIFLHPDKYVAEILHFGGKVEERGGPGQMAAQWARTYAHGSAETDLLPRWPILTEERTEPLSASENILAARRSSSRFGEGDAPDLSNAANLPFDSATLTSLLKNLETYFVDQVKDMCRFPAMKKVRRDDLEWMIETKARAFHSLEEFYKIEASLVEGRYRFALDSVLAKLPKLADLPTHELKYLKDDEDGYCCLAYRHSTLKEKPSIAKTYPLWWSSYSADLYWKCVKAYTANPDSLHPALRERMEHFWSDEAKAFNGSMGLAPEGDIYTPHGPDNDAEELLMLPTTMMQGWIWGDVYSIIFFIKRKHLQKGDFSKVEIDITN